MEKIFERLMGIKTHGRDGTSVIEMGEEDSLFHEQVKALRSKFEYKVDMLKYRTVAVTSAIAGEGKTVLTANLAYHLAAGGRKKVLIIDVDFRKSDLARGLKISPLPGLSEYLSGSVTEKDILRNYFMPGLYVITAGTRVSNPGDLLTGEKFRSFLKRISGEFDIVILDSPPILPVADTLSLRDQVNGFIFVYRARMTPHIMFRQAANEIGEKNIIGVILNGVEPQNEQYYKRYYGKYYSKNTPITGD